MRAFLYACTTAADLGQTVFDEKLPELKRLAASRGWDVAGTYTDAIPNGVGKRPGFSALCAALAGSGGGVVVANDPSDLFWDIGRGLDALREVGLGDRVDLVFTRDDLDATTAAGKEVLLKALSVFDRWSRGRARKRQQIGRLRAMSKADGISIAGRPRVTLNPDEVRGFYERGLTCGETAEALARAGCPVSKSTIAKSIRNARAAGLVDEAARATALARRGGIPKGGRPSTRPAAPPA